MPKKRLRRRAVPLALRVQLVRDVTTLGRHCGAMLCSVWSSHKIRRRRPGKSRTIKRAAFFGRELRGLLLPVNAGRIARDATAVWARCDAPQSTGAKRQGYCRIPSASVSGWIFGETNRDRLPEWGHSALPRYSVARRPMAPRVAGKNAIPRRVGFILAKVDPASEPPIPSTSLLRIRAPVLSPTAPRKR